MKQKARLEKWTVIEAAQISWLEGVVYDHPNTHLNGHRCHTSALISLDETGGTAETQNTIYTLGDKLAEAA